MSRIFLLCLLAGAALLHGQRFGGNDQTIRAQIRGGGGEWGKCTAEVEVDDVAEVGISGDQGRIRTLSGGTATWRRLECSSPLPGNPVDFRLRGIDGRGRQDLAQDPRSNRGVAVVRISDPKGGREGYTFDIEWRGGSSGGGFGGGWGDQGGGWGNQGGGRGNQGGWGGNQGGWGGGNSGWGPNNNSGWNSGWGENLSFRGRGNGNFNRSGNQTDLNGVDVYVDRRAGTVRVVFDTPRGRNSLSFEGNIESINGDTIRATLRSGTNQGDTAQARGTAEINVDRNRRVDWINMRGNVANGNFNLRWQN